MECRVTTRNDNPTINISRIIAAIAAIVLVVNFICIYCLKPYICISFMSGNKLQRVNQNKKQAVKKGHAGWIFRVE